MVMESVIPRSLLNYYRNKSELLSLSFEKQLSKLQFLGDYITEDIANEWMDEDIVILEKYFNQGILSRNIMDLYCQINNGFIDASNGGDKYELEIWTLTGLKYHSFWKHQRQLAKQLLEELNNIQV